MTTEHQIDAVTKLPRFVMDAVHTAVCEVPEDTHPDDIADCVAGMVGLEAFNAHEEAILNLIAKLA